MHDAAIIFTPEDEVVLDVNARACEVYGRTREQFVGVSLREISRDPDSGGSRVRETLAREQPNAFSTVQYRGDGTELRLAVRAMPIEFRGRDAILSVNRQITDPPAVRQ